MVAVLAPQTLWRRLLRGTATLPSPPRTCLSLLVTALFWHTPFLAAQESVRPDRSGEAIEVQASIIMLDLDGIDDASQSFDANVYFSLEWSEPSRAEPQILAGSRWSPLVAFGNQQRVWPVLPESFDTGKDGSVRLSRGVWGSFSQPLDLRRFPFDRQVLNVVLLADAGPDDLRFVADPERPSGISDALSIPDWTVTGIETTEAPFFISEGIDPVPAFTLRVTVERRVLYYVYTMLLPLMVIVGMAYMVFWIDPANFGTQIAVASTSMLTVVTYRIAAVQTLPRTAYFTDMDIYIAGCTVLVFLALVATIVTTVMFRRGHDTAARRIDVYGRYAFPAAFLALTGVAFA